MNLALESIQSNIVIIRGQKVILDRDLAELYGVETKYLKRQVKRNSDRFPEDFMFELTKDELRTVRGHFGTSSNDAKSLRGHFGTLKNNRRGKHSKYKTLAFTEHGCLQAANVLRSKQAKEMSIAIIRVFTHLRQMLSSHEQLRKLVLDHEDEIRKIWFELEKLNFEQEREGRSPIGFDVKDAT